MRVRAWLAERSPRHILLGALTLFWIYCWPGFVGWDTREHILQSRAGIYTDGHPPAVAYLQRICELFVAGPLLMMLVQSIALITGLHMLFRLRLSERGAAIAASTIFLFPPISGVTGLVAKDGLMAGFLMIGIALMANRQHARPVLAFAFLVAASLMRWNALAATFAPTLLLFRWRFDVVGIRRYAIAVVAWVGLTGTAYAANAVLTDREEHLWYWSYAYEDIAGTLQHVDNMDDAALLAALEGVPLVASDNLHARFRAIYNPLNFYHLIRPPTALFRIPQDRRERDAVYAAWRRVVRGNLGAYLKYRVENYEVMMMLDRSHPTISNVYVWLTVIAAPETISELEHDAAFSHAGSVLRDAMVWISLYPI